MKSRRPLRAGLKFFVSIIIMVGMHLLLPLEPAGSNCGMEVEWRCSTN